MKQSFHFDCSINTLKSFAEFPVQHFPIEMIIFQGVHVVSIFNMKYKNTYFLELLFFLVTSIVIDA